jgi:hypothetical protein
MNIRKLAWSSCVLAALSLGGCMLDTTAGGEDDGPLGSESSELTEGVLVAPETDQEATADGQEAAPVLPGDAISSGQPRPGDMVTLSADPNEPHPDPWKLAATPEAGDGP